MPRKMMRPRLVEIRSPEERGRSVLRREGLLLIPKKSRKQIARERLARLGRGASKVGRGAVVVGKGAVRVGGDLAKEEMKIERELGFNVFTSPKRKGKRRK